MSDENPILPESEGEEATSEGTGGKSTVPSAGQAGTYSVSGMYREWFLDYASYVILERAVPALYDGLKPVQRRILHAKDVTGREIERALLNAAQEQPAIQIFEDHLAIDHTKFKLGVGKDQPLALNVLRCGIE